ncbi:MAG: acyl-CoA thioesterase [Gammaproteobacteria bacterium]
MKHPQIEITVRGFHIDVFGHVNNARYLEFMEEARWAIFNKTLITLREQNMSLAIVNININYRRAALLDQHLVIDAEVERFGNTSFVIAQKVIAADNPDIIFADATVTSVILNQEGKPMKLDDSLRHLLFA